MVREEAFGLYVSLAMHAAILAALEIEARPDKRKLQAVEVSFLEVLPTQLPWTEGELPTNAEDSCSEPPMSRPPPEVAVLLNIAEGSLTTAFRAFSQQARVAWAADSQLLEGKRTSALQGLYKPSDAADRLLRGTGLCSVWIEGDLILNQCADSHSPRTRPSFGASDRASPCGTDEPSPEPNGQALPPAIYT